MSTYSHTYAFIVCRFLIAHHVGEDKFVFPFMAASSGENTLIEKEIEEHLELEVTIDNIKRAIRSARQDQLAKDEAVAYVQGQFEGIGAVLLGESGHLNREEMKFSAAHMRSWGISENSLRVVSEQLHSVIPDYLDRMDGLIFIMCHLTDKEKLFWDERIPCIVTKFKFPRRAKKNNRLWALAPYCRTSAGGECAWYQHKVVHEQSQWSKIKIG